MSVLADAPSGSWATANPPLSGRIERKNSPNSSVPLRSCSLTRMALTTAWLRATCSRCSSSDERAKA